MRNEANQLGQIIRSHRLKHNYTQEQLAELVDVTHGFLGQVERGESYPSIEILTKLIRQLNIDANTLFYPEQYENEIAEELINNEILIRVKRLNSDNKECILTLAQKLMDIQNKRK